MSSLTGLQKNEFWIGATLVVGGFIAGFGAYMGMLAATNTDKVAQGTYILRTDLAKDFIARADLAEDFITSRECEQRATMGYKHADLVSNLLEAIPGTSMERMFGDADAELVGGCMPDEPVSPAVRVSILAYLNSGDQQFRHKAVLAYSNCAERITDAYLLARTIASDEKREMLEAYALSINAIVENTQQREAEFGEFREYLGELGVPASLVAAVKPRSRFTQ